jgi:hypothetical protein
MLSSLLICNGDIGHDDCRSYSDLMILASTEKVLLGFYIECALY